METWRAGNAVRNVILFPHPPLFRSYLWVSGFFVGPLALPFSSTAFHSLSTPFPTFLSPLHLQGTSIHQHLQASSSLRYSIYECTSHIQHWHSIKHFSYSPTHPCLPPHPPLRISSAHLPRDHSMVPKTPLPWNSPSGNAHRSIVATLPASSGTLLFVHHPPRNGAT